MSSLKNLVNSQGECNIGYMPLCNTSTQEAEAGGSPGMYTLGNPGLEGRFCLNKQTNVFSAFLFTFKSLTSEVDFDMW